MIAPVVVGLLALTYAPSLVSFALSFTQWDLLSPVQLVGLANYTSLFTALEFWQVLGTTAIFVASTTGLQLVLGTLLAWWLYQLAGQSPKAKTLAATVQTLYFMPYVTPMVAVALVFGWLFEGEQGLANQLALWLGLVQTPQAWLHQAPTALAGVITLDVWKTLGYTFLLVLAGLQALSPAVLEAAELDGATGWRQLRLIVLPLIAPTLWVVGLLTVIHAMLAFDAIYLLTQGGPNKATTVLVFWLFQQAFLWYSAGKASAIAYVLAVMLVGLTLVQWRIKASQAQGGHA
jgi:multiple sugar transport system permease protein